MLNVKKCKEIAINIHFPNLFIIRDITKGSKKKSLDFHYKGQQPHRINTASEPSKRNSQLYFSFSSIIFIHRSYKMSVFLLQHYVHLSSHKYTPQLSKCKTTTTVLPKPHKTSCV